MFGVTATAPAGHSAARVRRARAETWLDDLTWHRRMFQQSRFRWTGEHVLSIVTRYTGGQLVFSTVEQLELLQDYQRDVRGYSHQCRLAMAEPLQQAQQTLGGRWDPTGEALGMSVVDCEAIVWSAVGEPPEARTNVNIASVLHRLPFANPLIECWELKQLCGMYQAAVDVFEETICDLVDELAGAVPIEQVVTASGSLSAGGLRARVEDARGRRGRAGDRRREPAQAF